MRQEMFRRQIAGLGVIARPAGDDALVVDMRRPLRRIVHQLAHRIPHPVTVGIDRVDAAARDDVGLLNVLTLPVDRTVVIQLGEIYERERARVTEAGSEGLVYVNGPGADDFSGNGSDLLID